MAIAKMKIGGKWVNLYADEINSRLKISENLADVADKAIARENLELVGDVNTHNHDSQYLSLIQQLATTGEESLASVEAEAKKRIEEDSRIESNFESAINVLRSDLAELQDSHDFDVEDIRAQIGETKEEITNINVTASKVNNDSFVYRTTSSSTGSGSSPIVTTTNNYNFKTQKGISAGKYDLLEIIQQLVNLSHNHKNEVTTTTSTWQCNCDYSNPACGN